MLLLILSLKLREGATISHGAEDVGNRGLGAGGLFLGGGHRTSAQSTGLESSNRCSRQVDVKRRAKEGDTEVCEQSAHSPADQL